MQRRHCRNCKLELVLCPGGSGTVVMQHIDEAVLLRQQSWRTTSPKSEDYKCYYIFESQSAADSLVFFPLKEGIPIDEEDDAQYNVRVIYSRESSL